MSYQPSDLNAHNHHASCKVYGVPRAKVHGLSMAQSKAARTATLQHRVMGAGVNGPMGLGMMSAARIDGPVLHTRHAPPETVRPGTRRRSPKMRIQNRPFGQCVARHRVAHVESVLAQRKRLQVDRLVERIKYAIRKKHSTHRLRELATVLVKLRPSAFQELIQLARTVTR